ncbi:DUF4268 domain-containing protein [Candidatus Micrarchaeota archaeon]|nr:DUF4268 domain-containing protein [Candidatus Micrarchaeota archaeon]
MKPKNTTNRITTNLVSLKRIKPKTVFDDERELTSYISENEFGMLNALSESIGLTIIDTEHQKFSGRYYEDITGTIQETGDKIIIEVQFGTSNHDHLGKIVTYSAAEDARFAVWIAEKFNEEHITALDIIQLNIFAVEFRIYQINDSPYAFDYNVVRRPEFTLTEKQKTEKKIAYENYFSLLSDALAPLHVHIKPAVGQHVMMFNSGRSNIFYSIGFNPTIKKYSIDLIIHTTQSPDKNHAILHELEKYKTDIEKVVYDDVDGEMVWEELPVAARVRLSIPCEKQIIELTDEDKIHLIDWSRKAVEKMLHFKKILSKIHI